MDQPTIKQNKTKTVRLLYGQFWFCRVQWLDGGKTVWCILREEINGLKKNCLEWTMDHYTQQDKQNWMKIFKYCLCIAGRVIVNISWMTFLLNYTVFAVNSNRPTFVLADLCMCVCVCVLCMRVQVASVIVKCSALPCSCGRCVLINEWKGECKECCPTWLRNAYKIWGCRVAKGMQTGRQAETETQDKNTHR